VLTWLGRGEYSSFAETREEASDMRDKHIPEYLIGTPKLGEIAYELTVTEVSPMKAVCRLSAAQEQESQSEARC